MAEYPLYTNNAFSVSPLSKRFYAKPGESYSGYIRITNPVDADHELNYSVSVIPYTVTGEEYDIDFSVESSYNQIMDWITFDKTTGTVQPNSSELIYYSINVPEDAPGGGQYCAIAVQNVIGDNASVGESTVSIGDVLEIASVVYASVDGEVIRTGEVLENTLPAVVLTPPAISGVHITNTGNVHQDASVTITAKSALTGEPIFLGDEDAVEESDALSDHFSTIIMPETTRYFYHAISGLPEIGIFDVTQEVIYSGMVYTETKTIVACPVWLLSIILAVFTGVIALIVYRIRRRANIKLHSQL